MSNWQIKSIQIALPREHSDGSKVWQTGIFKQPVEGSIALNYLGLIGDGVGDTVNHGGEDKAVCCHPWQHYEYWNAYFQWNLALGAFGENLTLTGLTEIDVCVGDIWQIGSATVQVSQPRVPCWKQSNKLGYSGFEKLTLQSGRSGFYLRVLEEGSLSAGDTITLVDRPHATASLVRLNRALLDRQNQALMEEFIALPALSDAWREMFSDRLAQL